ncbi:MAG: iron ABC transporter permease [Candidatus Latescibacteria bacterium]|nr:iron ABC transporter permease [Candidatus Latescibacterota bacterium]
MAHLTSSRLMLASLIALGALVLASIVALAVGSTSVPLSDVVDTFMGDGRGVSDIIVRQIRLPRVALAALVGGSLAAAGVIFQALLRNPLADPYVLGISGGGGLGAVLAVSVGGSISVGTEVLVPIWAFVGSLGAIALVYTIARSSGSVNMHTMLLAGVVTNAICSALIMGLTLTLSFEKFQTVLFWLMGHLSSRLSWGSFLHLGAYVGVGLVMIGAVARDLNLMSLGDRQAAHLGTNVERTKAIAFIGASLITGAAVSAAGLVGFVGLMVPHGVRLLVGPDHRILLPISVVVGAAFLILTDATARWVIAPTELPVGVITALIGGPSFIWMLRQRDRGGA